MNKPNIIFILADDMGYGDVRQLNSGCKFPTPSLDRLCKEGVHFTDAHTSSSVCTPSRYSILTGRYCWRTYMKKGVLTGVGEPLIDKERTTIASMLRDAGYKTGCVGKWHVGWNWAIKEGMENIVNKESWKGDDISWIDYSKPISDGPTEVGFDYFYGISGSLDMPPYVYVENDMPLEEPASWGDASEFFRAGPRMDSLRANNVLGHITDKAVCYINEQDSEQPFFLYFPITAPHTPIAPSPKFDGVSGINSYADFCMEVDARVGQVLDAIDNKGIADNTLVVFTTDNGASAEPSECAMLEKCFGHYCSYVYRGYKSDIWDGGHRIPFLMRWSNGIEASSIVEQSVGVFDMFATVAEIIGQDIPDNAGEDSVSFLPALTGGHIDENKRKALIHHSIDGMFAIRKGKWKLCRCPGSGGWTQPTDESAIKASLHDIQLYDMETDPREQNNLSESEPKIVEEMTRLLHECVAEGRTTSGSPQQNAKEVGLEDWSQLNWLPQIPECFVSND